MTITSVILLVLGGIVIGLFLPAIIKLFKLQFIIELIEAVIGSMVGLFSGLDRLFKKREKSMSKPKPQEVVQGPKTGSVQQVDPREEQINDSAQMIRTILLNMAGLIHRADQAAQNSSTTLGDVRSTIDDMHLPPDLSEVHNLLMVEIDRMIAGNSTLKSELARSKENLEVQRQQIENLKTAVRIDALTQIANRAYFEEKLAEMLRLRNRYNDPFSLLLIDVDNFKTINDTYGHIAGDRILKGVALKLKATIRESDFISRLGGDEFALILVKLHSDRAVELGWKICRFMEESRFLLDGKELTITISIGVTEAIKGDNPEDLIKRADKALYLAKHEGRNRAVMTLTPKVDESQGKS
jgi:diguanylate cyclase